MKQKISVLHFLTVIFLLGMHPAVHASLSCTIDNFDVWDAGFNINVSVTNNGTQPVNPWEVELTFNESVQIQSFWNAQVTLNGLTVEATGLSHNAVLNPGQSVSFGFQGSHSSGSNLATPVCTEAGSSSSSSSSSTSSSTSSTTSSSSSGASTSSSSSSTSSGSSTSSSSSSTSSGSSTSSSSSSGGTTSHSVWPTCPDASDGAVIGGSALHPTFNPDDFEGSKVAYPNFVMFGSGSHSSTIRYSNGSEFNRPMRVELDGETVIEQIDFPPTGDWENWTNLVLDRALTSGQYNFISLSPEGGPNLQNITTTLQYNCTICGYTKGTGACPDPDSGSSSSSSTSSSTSSTSSSSSSGSGSSSSSSSGGSGSSSSSSGGA